MPLPKALDRLINHGKEKLQEFTHPGAPQGYYAFPAQPQPPPINYATRPAAGGSGGGGDIIAPLVASRPYWQAYFDPSIPITSIFEHETGAHGWGNHETQNYTTHAANSFFTPDHKLILRAIAQPNSREPYTSARLVSRQKLARDSGCVTVVLTTPCATGIWPAFWLLPSEPYTWPIHGEVDICETWDGVNTNHSCLHWGHYNAADKDKHRVTETPLGPPGYPHEYTFAWYQEQGADGGGRLVWWIDDRAVMKAQIPRGIRRLSDFTVIINVAMGGDVCQGRLPAPGIYDLVVHSLSMADEPRGGWARFHSDWQNTPEGHTM